MKLKMFFALLAIGLFSFALQSCDDDDDGFASAPNVIEEAFNQKFNDVHHKWETRGSYYVAEFKHENHHAEAWFTPDGKWMMTETDIPYEALPQAVKTAFEASEYAAWKRDDVDRLEREGMETVYVIEVEKGKDEVDLYFDANGNLIKAVVDTDNNSEDYLPAPLADAVKQQLETMYPGYRLLEIDVEKVGTETFTEVDILHNKTKKEVLFSADGKWYSTSWEVRITDVPKTLVDKVLEANPGFRIDDDEADFVESVNGSFYVIELEKGETEIHVRISVEGEILK